MDENGTFVIDLNDFSPGSHILNVVATSEDGDIDIADTILFVAPASLGEKSF